MEVFMNTSRRPLIISLIMVCVAPCHVHAWTVEPARSAAQRTGAISRKGYLAECRRRQRSAANKGALAGAVGGAVVGAAVMATPVAVGVGAVTGHQLGKHHRRC